MELASIPNPALPAPEEGAADGDPEAPPLEDDSFSSDDDDDDDDEHGGDAAATDDPRSAARLAEQPFLALEARFDARPAARDCCCGGCRCGLVVGVRCALRWVLLETTYQLATAASDTRAVFLTRPPSG